MLARQGECNTLDLSGKLVGGHTFWGISMSHTADFFRARVDEMVIRNTRWWC
jgi:hypothetical protein